MALLAAEHLRAGATATTSPRLGHVPALDGLRGVAVLGVVAFHLGWIDGGYLGVDAFFVLSGFLITSLLLAEHDRAGRIAMTRFWGRRARRLLPAMLAMVAFVLLWTMVADRAQLAEVRGDAVATLLYVANWHEIATTSSYWAIFDAPSPLQHTWSLAIEEQFYLAWPLVVVAAAFVALRLRRHLATTLGVVALVLAAGSYVLMAALASGADTTRAYYGTGSRIGAIALGAGLAALCGRRLLRPEPTAGDRGLDALAVVALALLAWAWLTVGGTTGWLYRGGFVLLGLAVAVVIAAACRPGGLVAAGLSWRPLRAVGVISYGLYLWHWVAIAIVTEARTGLDGLALDLLQLAVGLAAALGSYWLLEQPVRSGRWLRQSGTATATAVGASGLVLGLAWATVLVPAPDFGGLATRLRADPAPVPVTTVVATVPAPGPRSPVVAPTITVATLPPPRLGVFGDSTAVRTGSGLTAFGRRTGAFEVVVNAARVGCGVDQGGERRFLGETFALASFCGDLRQAWTSSLASHPVDVAVIQTGMWETVERRLPGDTSWRAVGDPLVDARVTEELRVANAFWASRGIPVVWLRGPVPSDAARRPGTMERFNELLVQVVAEFPAAGVVPLDSFLTGLPDADEALLRPDGIHFTEESSALVADAWLGQQVAEAADRLRRRGSDGS